MRRRANRGRGAASPSSFRRSLLPLLGRRWGDTPFQRSSPVSTGRREDRPVWEASRSGEQGRGQGEGDGAVPSRIGEEGLFVGGENPFGKGGRGLGRRERLETVMASQKVVLCGLVQALRALDLLHFLVPEQEARFGQLNGLPRQQ